MTQEASKLREVRFTEPDPEVPEKAKRRRFSAQYKLRILREAEACSEPGEVGALLRREGLYSSHLASWRQQREEGALAALSKKRGRKPKRPSAEARRVAELERENERLRRQLQKAETIIEVQKNDPGRKRPTCGLETPEEVGSQHRERSGREIFGALSP